MTKTSLLKGGFTAVNSIYSILVFLHIVSAILGLGPGFALNFLPRGAKNMDQLRHAFMMRHKVHIFVMIGGSLLLVTGLLMGALKPFLFQQGWYITSLTLYLIALAMGKLILTPLTKPIKQLLETHKGDGIPEEYQTLWKKVSLWENILNGIFIIIITLMITKPF